MKISWWKEKFKPFLMPLVSVLDTVHPNWITVAGFVLAMAVAWVVTAGGDAPGLYIVGAFLLLAQVLADYLDGLVARTFSKKSQSGALLDRSLDRVADLLLVGALTYITFPDIRAVLISDLILICFFIIYYSIESQKNKRFDSPLSRTDIHLLISAFLLVNGTQGLLNF